MTPFLAWVACGVVLTVVLRRSFQQAKDEERVRRLERWRREALENERAAEWESEAATEAFMDRLARHIAEARRS